MALTTASSASKTQVRSYLTRWEGTLGPDDRALFAAFVDEVLTRLRGPFLAHHPPSGVLSYLEEAFRFARGPNTGSMRVTVRARATKGLAVMVNMPDQPFIVDTLRLFLAKHRADYWGGFNLVFRAERDQDGTLLAVGTEAGLPESLVMLEADTGSLPGDLTSAVEALRTNLTKARAMVADFKAMTRSLDRFAERCAVLGERRPDQAEAMRETSEFIRWLLSENFVFMGVLDGTDALGTQRVDGGLRAHATGSWPEPHFPRTVRVRKSHDESPVHRAGRIDQILISVGEQGDPSAMTLFITGMFTYRAVTQPSRNVPILRRVLADILAEQSSGPGSFRYKGIANVFDSLPTEFLFTATQQSIDEMVDLVFESEQQQEVGVTFLMNGHDSAFCLVAMPKSQFADRLRRNLEREIIEATGSTYCDHGLFMGRYDTVLLHYYLTGVTYPGDAAVKQLTETIRQAATPWLARLWVALAERFDEGRADSLTDTYGRAFPAEWTRNTTVTRAVRDIELLETLAADRTVQADVFEDGDDLILRVYQASDVYLSDLLPVLSNFGVRIIDSYATQVNSRGGPLHLDTFRLKADPDDRKALRKAAPLLTEAISRVFTGDVDDDRLNAMVIAAGLTWSEVDMVRGYAAYLRQLQIKLSVVRLVEILVAHPLMVASLVRLFHARFDPDQNGSREAAIAAADEVVRDELRYILAHDEDLAFSAVRALINATLRTNYYRTDRVGGYLSFKVDCSKIAFMGDNRPMFEIYVHSRDVEGVHLRFGRIARGGLRWSDRDDYRTEVVGLVTTQRVKNVVIVPTGSKGGFYLKNAPRNPGERRRQADEKYKTFIRGLLDLTDNRVDGKIVPPPRVVRHDGDDPYLVVAADKGTAHLSDIANQISVDYGFWLGDAFASGGSQGYDHKAVGITARGAWVLVRRHFAELGIDPYSQEFTCVGVGDLSGDVFGNGLVESPHTLLLAAFNHLHIFLDPTPDAAVSYAERRRLFDNPGGWDKYDTSLISAGGGVFDRRAKSVPLSKQARKMLGLDTSEAQPEQVINAILKMKADLFWNGGIGTYVKATTETHADADDRSNNAIRIDAPQLGARIVGEGGNLGMTQRGRIEAEQHGVRLNTDAIDNSAGVDMSDHEVNLKVLLNGLVEAGTMSVAARNKLLEQMTDEVADLVLADNDAHGRQLSRDQIRSRENIFVFGRAISFVEKEFGRTRASLTLPSNKELQARSERGEGLTRPELSVLSAWVKMWISGALLAGRPKGLPGYSELLSTYFPKRLRKKYASAISKHMLADEIATTVATTRMVADAGAAFFPLLTEATGAGVPEIAEAFLKAQHLTGTKEVRTTLEELRAEVSLGTLYQAWVDIDAGTREVASYWLSARGRIPGKKMLDEMKAAASQVYELQASDDLVRARERFDMLINNDIPEPVARSIMRAQTLNITLTVWAEAKRTKTPFQEIAVRHLAIGRASRLQEVLDDLASRPAEGRWDPIALRILHTRIHKLLRSLVGKCPPDLQGATVDQLEPHLVQGQLAGVRAQVDDMLGQESSPSVATLMVLEERVAAAIRRL